MYLNEVLFAGNLGANAEDKTLDSGTRVVNFSICYNEKDKAGTERSTWVRVSVFGNWCDSAATFKKGDNVVVKGKLTISIKGDKSYAEILAYSCGVLAKAETKAFEAPKPAPSSSPGKVTSKTVAFDEDIPF